MQKVAPRNKEEAVPGLLVISAWERTFGHRDSDSSGEYREARLREKWWGVSVCGVGSQPGGGSGI